MALPSVAALSSSIKSATVNEGTVVRVKQEQPDEAEIRELAAKLVEANKAKMAAMPQTPTSRSATSGASQGQTNILGYFNRIGNKVTPSQPSPDSTDKKKEKPAIDEQSQKGRFGWVTMGKTYIPYIIRTPDEKYCAVRIVETKLLSKYMNCLHADIYSCTCIRSYYITEAEARLFNEINIKHCEMQFGREAFTTKDLVVRLQDASEFYNFLDVCYNKLLHCGNDAKDKCGFIRINGESVVPYTVRDGNKYVPLFYFEGETDNLKLKAEKLENWDLAYLKFCCKVQGIRNELFASETCSVISLTDIKSYFPTGTLFEDYWPNKLMESQLLVLQKGSTAGGIASWIKAPPGATPPATNAATTIVVNKVIPTMPSSRTAPPPAPPPVQPTPLSNGWPGLVGGQPTYQPSSNRLGQSAISSLHSMNQATANRSYQVRSSIAPQPQPPQYYPSPHSMSQAAQMVPQPPPLVRVTGPPPSMGFHTYAKEDWTTGSYSTATMSNNATAMHLMGLSDRGGSMLPPPPHLQYPTHNSTPVSTNNTANQQVKYPPPLIPVNGSNPRYLSYQPGAEVIDLSSPPQSPQTQQQQRSVAAMNNGKTSQQSSPQQSHNDPNGIWKKLIPIMEAPPSSGSHLPFKIQKALVNEKMVPCINAKPFIYSELLMTIPDLVSHFFPSVDMDKCRQVLQEVLKVNLYRGNSQQMQILRENQKCKSPNEILPLIQLRDVLTYMPQLKYMLERPHCNNEPSSKRQRTS
ncbi:uncharacterized protein LOC142327528 isoform X2 [Lycorma delicatula]|uniref:uncharacterized protein LOC142327528 isoform X2 n=1 Tax=Lycorma delicatula TaxID=130591 RepID=UPI003F515B31